MVKYPSGSMAAFRKTAKQPKLRRSYHHKKSVIFSDRGMTLEQQINESNKYYLEEGVAVVEACLKYASLITALERLG